MSTSATSVDHIFNAIRREFSDEFQELTIVFVLYDPGHLQEALEAKRAEILSHPAGEEAFAEAAQEIKTRDHGRFCASFKQHTTPKAMGLLKKTEALGICFIPKSDTALFEDLNFACRHAGYAAGFLALHEYITSSHGKKDERTEKIESDPARFRAYKLRIRLMAGCFATMLMENMGTKGTIQNVLKKYCSLTTGRALLFWPEDHPMPMAIDGLNVVYKDLKDEAGPKTGPLEHLHYMAEEIGNTYDDISILQWSRFAHCAQEMAWAGYNPNEILSAAIYSSDNPYIRSNAHICAESLNTTPVPLKNTDTYNPFADEETIERNHLRICRIGFMNLLEKINETDRPEMFFEKAREQTRKLLEGNPIGWCAPALVEAENAYRLFKETRNAEEEMIGNAFQAVCSRIKWRDLQRLNRKLIRQRRMGYDISSETVLELMGDDEAYASYKNIFEMLWI